VSRAQAIGALEAAHEVLTASARLLDEQLPRRVARELTGHDVRTVQPQGWAGLRNGELLRRAANEGFEVLLTSDQNHQFQQNLSLAQLGVVVLVAIHLKIYFRWFHVPSMRSPGVSPASDAR
jgi:hypothetical protein